MLQFKEYLVRAEQLKGVTSIDTGGNDSGLAAAQKVKKPGQNKEEVGLPWRRLIRGQMTMRVYCVGAAHDATGGLPRREQRTIFRPFQVPRAQPQEIDCSRSPGRAYDISFH